jgi:hypothetical protein
MPAESKDIPQRDQCVGSSISAGSVRTASLDPEPLRQEMHLGESERVTRAGTERRAEVDLRRGGEWRASPRSLIVDGCRRADRLHGIDRRPVAQVSLANEHGGDHLVDAIETRCGPACQGCRGSGYEPSVRDEAQPNLLDASRQASRHRRARSIEVQADVVDSGREGRLEHP